MFYVTDYKPECISNDLMDRMVCFAADYLEIDTEIEVSFDGEFDDCCGYVEYEPEDSEITVYINPTKPRTEMIKTFFHEMVHVKQYIKGELVSGIGKRPSRWKGKEVDKSYFESPWEIEAFEHELIMFDIFKISC